MKKYSFCFVLILMLCTSCDDFVFGNMNIDYNENPLEHKEVPHSGADATRRDRNDLSGAR